MARVERRHREAAVAVLMLGASDAIDMFESIGATGGDEYLEQAARVAQLVADTEERASSIGFGLGRSVERTDVLAVIPKSMDFAEMIAAGEHLGAAECQRKKSKKCEV